jgi:hypothetical protein
MILIPCSFPGDDAIGATYPAVAADGSRCRTGTVRCGAAFRQLSASFRPALGQCSPHLDVASRCGAHFTLSSNPEGPREKAGPRGRGFAGGVRFGGAWQSKRILPPLRSRGMERVSFEWVGFGRRRRPVERSAGRALGAFGRARARVARSDAGARALSVRTEPEPA